MWLLFVRAQEQTQEWLGEPGLKEVVRWSPVLVAREVGALPPLLLAGRAGLVAEGLAPRSEVVPEAERAWMPLDEDLRPELRQGVPVSREHSVAAALLLRESRPIRLAGWRVCVSDWVTPQR